MKHLLTFLALFVFVSGATAEELKQNISSYTANVKIEKTVQITNLPRPVFSDVICNFVITPTESSPPSVILSGKVVSNNSGGSQEFVPIFFGSSAHLPRLAAMTNVDGEFRFRVYLNKMKKQKVGNNEIAVVTTSHRLQTPRIEEGTVYLGGQFNKQSEMLSGGTDVYALREFLQQKVKPKDKS